MTFLNLLLNPFFIICLYIFFYKFFFIYKETSKNLPSKYYQENKERLKAQLNKTREKYQQFSKEKKNQKEPQYGRERYKDLSEDEKQKLVEYRKNIKE